MGKMSEIAAEVEQLDKRYPGWRNLIKEPAPTECYYIISLKHSREKDFWLLWNPDGKGYTADISKAGVYQMKGGYKVFEHPHSDMWAEDNINVPVNKIHNFGTIQTVIRR